MQLRLSNRSANGTSFHGSTVRASKKQLVAILGEPNSDGDGYKVNYEWNLEHRSEDAPIDVVTLYDWREGPISDDRMIDWHVGGNNKTVTDYVAAEITKRLSAHSRIEEHFSAENTRV